jgi:hypothetical protein
VKARLRDELQGITEVEDISRHGILLDALNVRISYSISKVESEFPLDKYTCAVYAFDLGDDPTYEDIATFGLGSTFAGREFVEFALDNGQLDIAKVS